MRFKYLALLPALAACGTSSPTETTAATAPAADTTAGALPAPDTARTRAVSAAADTLASARQAHAFSQPGGKPDVFRLVLRGKSLLDGTAAFTITNPDGQEIFRESLAAADLEAAMVYEMKKPTATPAEREAYVRRRVREFFAPAQFRHPAVAAGAARPTGPGAPDAATWNDLRQRPQSVRFSYLVGKEDRRAIAWSPLKKQVVPVGL